VDEILIEFSKISDREFEVMRLRLENLAGVRELNAQSGE
jgi:hypothetical protein